LESNKPSDHNGCIRHTEFHSDLSKDGKTSAKYLGKTFFTLLFETKGKSANLQHGSKPVSLICFSRFLQKI